VGLTASRDPRVGDAAAAAPPAGTAIRPLGRSLVLWLALGAALSPSLVDLARHWALEPWARYSALFVPLLVLAGWTDPRAGRPRADGYALLGLGLILSVATVGGGMPRLGRPGIVLAVLGLARVLGRPSPARALLAAFAIPVPYALSSALGPGLALLAAHATAAAAHAAGGAVELLRSDGAIRLAGAQGSLTLGPVDGGLPAIALLAGLGWYRAARRGAPVAGAAWTALRWAPLGLAAQALLLAGAGTVFLVGQPAVARGILDHGVWAVAAAALLATRRHPAPEPAPAGERPS
jgi:hypothetical protein